MTETILNVLDQQVDMAPGTQQSKGLSASDNQIKRIQDGKPTTSNQKEGYPDLFLPVMENYRISDHFCGYSDSLSADNNPMVLVELKIYLINTQHLYMQWIGLTVLCMVSSVWDIESYLKRPQLYPNSNKLWWRMSIDLLMRTPFLGLLT